MYFFHYDLKFSEVKVANSTSFCSFRTIDLSILVTMFIAELE